jgi:hypothetical protein
MGQKKELDQQLWEFVYDLLSEREQEDIRAQITSDPDVARAYARVKLESELVGYAAQCHEDRIVLEPVADASVEVASAVLPKELSSPSLLVRRSADWFAGLAAAALVCLMGYGFARNTPSSTKQPLPEAEYVVTQLSAPDRIRDNLTNQFSVRTIDLSGAPQSTELEYRFSDSKGEIRLAGTAVTDARGRSNIELPGSLADEVAHLELTPVSHSQGPGIRADLEPTTETLSTSLTLAKPVYKPGERAHFRAVTLSTAELGPSDGVEVAFDVLDTEGRQVVSQLPRQTTNQGVTAGSFVIPSELTSGTYSIVAFSPQARFATVGQRFVVGPAQPVAPREPPSDPSLSIKFYPEGGKLVGGLANRVFFKATGASGKPVAIAGRVTNSAGERTAAVETEQAGRGVFEQRWEQGQSYQLELAEPADAEAQAHLPAISEDTTVAMRIAAPVIGAEDPLEVELVAPEAQERSLVVAAHCRDALVGQQTVNAVDFVADGETWSGRTTVPIAPEANGVLRVSLFDFAQNPPQPISEHLVFRRPQRQLKLQLENVAESYSPGSEVNLQVQATTETNEPTRAILGLRVLETPAERARSRFHPTLPSQYYLAAKLNEPEAIAHFGREFSWRGESERAIELLLGTDGAANASQSRFRGLVRSDPESGGGMGYGGFAAKGGASAESLAFSAGRLAGEPFFRGWGYLNSDFNTPAPLLYDNTSDVRRAAAQATRSTATSNPPDLSGIGRFLVFGGAILLVAALLLNLMRLTSGIQVWAPVVAAACASLLVGVIWLQDSQPGLGIVASSALESEPTTDDHSPADAEYEAGVSLPSAMLDAPAPVPPLSEKQRRDFPEERELDEVEGMSEALMAPSQQLGKFLKPQTATDQRIPAEPGEPAKMARGGDPQPLPEQPAPAAPRPTIKRSQPAMRMRSTDSYGQQAVPRRNLGEAAPSAADSELLMRQESQTPASQPALEEADRLMPGSVAGGARKALSPMAAGEAEAAAVRLQQESRRAVAASEEKETLLDTTAGGQQRLAISPFSALDDLSAVPALVHWDPLLATDEQGRATITFTVPDRTTHLQLHIDAHAPGRLGALETTIVTDAP